MNFIFFTGIIILWIIFSLNIATPGSIIEKLENSNDPSIWISALQSDDRNIRKYSEDNIFHRTENDELGKLALKALESGDTRAVVSALWILSNVEIAGKGAAAVGYINHENPSVREMALSVLASEPVPEAREILIELTDEIDFASRSNALKALSELANPDDLPIFLKHIGDPIESVRLAAHDGIIAIAPECPDIVTLLLNIAWGPDFPSSREAIKLIGELGLSEALDELFYFLDATLTGISTEAAIAIGKIGGQKAINRALELFFTGTNRIRSQAAKTLGELHASEAADELLKAAMNRDEDIWVRYHSLEALGNCGDEKMIPLILSIMENPENDSRLVRMGIETLGALDGKSVLNIYDRIIARELDFGLDSAGGQTSLTSAIIGLGKMNSDESRERLRRIIRETTDNNLDVIIAVIRALGNVGTTDDLSLIHISEPTRPY